MRALLLLFVFLFLTPQPFAEKIRPVGPICPALLTLKTALKIPRTHSISKEEALSKANATGAGLSHLVRDPDQLWNLLVQKEEEGRFHFPQDRNAAHPVQILNLACGNGMDGYLLASYFSREGKYLDPASSASKVFGMDIDSTINDDQLIYRPSWLKKKPQLAPLLDSVILKKADATLDSSYFGLPEKFDFVFIRHPASGMAGYPLHGIVDQGRTRLDAKGTMIVTTYYESELYLVKEEVERQSMKIIDFGENPRHRKEDNFDSFFLIAVPK